jgi:hypothetical protein
MYRKVHYYYYAKCWDNLRFTRTGVLPAHLRQITPSGVRVLFSSLRREEGGRAELLDKLQLIEFVYLWKGLSAGNLATGPKGTLETVRERSVRATIKEQSDPCREAWRVLTYFTCYRLKVGSTV